MTIQAWQKEVDQWIKTYGVRYFDVKTNALILTEEVGEFARVVARAYGEQSWKNAPEEGAEKVLLKDEITDIFWVITCLANQLDIDLTEALQQNIAKKTSRDKERHQENTKLK